MYTEGAAGDLLIAPLDHEHVVAAFTDNIVNFIHVTSLVFDTQFLTWSFGAHHSHKHHVVTCK